MQVLKPATRQKLRIIGDNYQEVITEFLQTLPLFLGGTCSCANCLDFSNVTITNGETIQESPRSELKSETNEDITETELGDDTNEIITETQLGDEPNQEITETSSSRNHKNHVNVGPPSFCYPRTSMSREQVVISTVIGIFVFWIFISFTWAARND